MPWLTQKLSFLSFIPQQFKMVRLYLSYQTSKVEENMLIKRYNFARGEKMNLQ